MSQDRVAQNPRMKALLDWKAQQDATNRTLEQLKSVPGPGNLLSSRRGRLALNEKAVGIIEEHIAGVVDILADHFEAEGVLPFMEGSWYILDEWTRWVKGDTFMQQIRKIAERVKSSNGIDLEYKKRIEVAAIELELLERRDSLKRSIRKDRILSAIVPTIHRSERAGEEKRISEVLEAFGKQIGGFYSAVQTRF